MKIADRRVNGLECEDRCLQRLSTGRMATLFGPSREEAYVKCVREY